MAIKHLPGFTPKELKKLNPDIPIYERREAWLSPLCIPLGIGAAIYCVFYGLFFIFKWLFLSWIVVFIDNKWFCSINLHKYRKISESTYRTEYKCKICNKEKSISNSLL